jgi:hypothetical protein
MSITIGNQKDMTLAAECMAGHYVISTEAVSGKYKPFSVIDVYKLLTDGW